MAAIGIVGGGIVGSAIAAWLAGDGHDVTVFERAPDERFASSGNAGIVTLPSISPLARPGILGAVPGWLLDPLGPLTIRARDLPALAPWLLRFALSARPSEVERSTAAIAFLMKTALADHQELARRAGLAGHMRRTGALHIFDSARSYRAAKEEWAERGRHGVEIRETSVEEARAMVPALRGGFSHALFAPDHWTVSSPLAILRGVRRHLGTRIVTANVTGVVPEPDGVAVVMSGERRKFAQVVVAGGVWSRDLVRGLGLSVLLEAERGYNTTYPTPPFPLPVPVFFDDHGFVASPLEDGLRVGGAVELAAVDAPPNYARAHAMREKMRRYFPDLPEEGGIEWMGRRPSTPELAAGHRRPSARSADPLRLRARPSRPDPVGGDRPPRRRAGFRPVARSASEAVRDRAVQLRSAVGSRQSAVGKKVVEGILMPNPDCRLPTAYCRCAKRMSLPEPHR